MDNQSKNSNQPLEYKGLTPVLIREVEYLQLNGITKDFLIQQKSILYNSFMRVYNTRDEYSRGVTEQKECIKKIGKVLDDIAHFKNEVFKQFKKFGYKLLLKKDFMFATKLLYDSLSDAIDGIDISVQIFDDYDTLVRNEEMGIKNANLQTHRNKGQEKND